MDKFQGKFIPVDNNHYQFSILVNWKVLFFLRILWIEAVIWRQNVDWPASAQILRPKAQR